MKIENRENLKEVFNNMKRALLTFEANEKPIEVFADKIKKEVFKDGKTTKGRSILPVVKSFCLIKIANPDEELKVSTIYYCLTHNEQLAVRLGFREMPKANTFYKVHSKITNKKLHEELYEEFTEITRRISERRGVCNKSKKERKRILTEKKKERGEIARHYVSKINEYDEAFDKLIEKMKKRRRVYASQKYMYSVKAKLKSLALMKIVDFPDFYELGEWLVDNKILAVKLGFGSFPEKYTSAGESIKQFFRLWRGLIEEDLNNLVCKIENRKLSKKRTRPKTLPWIKIEREEIVKPVCPECQTNFSVGKYGKRRLKSGKINGLFDMNKSGAMLAWQWFNPDQQPPKLIAHIQDRDLWLFKLEGTREIHAALSSYPYDFKLWDKLMASNDDELEALKRDGEAIERRLQKDVRELIASGVRRMVIAGYDVPVLNASSAYVSDAGHIMSLGEPFAACYWDHANGRSFSLRSSEEGIDVAEVAKKYAGGGHEKAAGFTVDIGWEGE